MNANSRILCSYNRRRLRIAPQHQLDEMQAIVKPRINTSKSRPESKASDVSENPLSMSFIKETRTEESEELEGLPSIFRRRVALDQDENDLFALKRANPVYDSDDEDCMSTPSKRQRTSQPDTLHWDEQLDGPDGNFTVSFHQN